MSTFPNCTLNSLLYVTFTSMKKYSLRIPALWLASGADRKETQEAYRPCILSEGENIFMKNIGQEDHS